jgi:hypothetical protein
MRAISSSPLEAAHTRDMNRSWSYARW